MLSLTEKRLRTADIAHLLPRARSCFDPIKQELNALQDYLLDSPLSSTSVPTPVVRYVFSSGGKRLRPAIFFLLCKMLGYRGKHLLPLAAVSEYMHTASLLHDDVIDNTTLRRRKPTVNSRWGDTTAILVGDLIYARACELMTATGDLRIIAAFTQAIKRMSEGELIQLENLYNLNITEETWLKIVHYKTGELLAATCKVAGLLAVADERTCARLHAFGLNIGIAFQLIDDALDFCGTEQELGKQTMIDLANGRVTLPIILLYQQGDRQVRETLRTVLHQPRANAAELQRILALTTRHATVARSVARAAEFTASAQRELAQFAPSPARQRLVELTNLLLSRLN